MDTRTKEAIRYLGYGKHAVDAQTLALVEDSFRELDQAARRRVVYRFFDVSFQGTEQLSIGKMEITSRNLCKNLQGCKEAVLMGATLGTQVDFLIKRYAVTDMARAVVVQAAAAAFLEEYLDECQQKIAKELANQNKALRPRFSPGYGDFDIRHQRMMLLMLNADKTIGLAMTDGCMLTPTKSVTAVIGICEEGENCPPQGCETCGKIDCTYRRKTE